MLLIDVTPEGKTYRECLIWFAEEPFCPAGYDIVRFKEARLEVSNGLFSPEPFNTLWSDLTLSEEELRARLNREKRKKIVAARKAEWLINVGNDDADIRRFHSAQTVFAASKQIDPPVALKGLQRNAEHCLAAFVYNREMQLVCWLLYLLNKPIVRQWYGGSDLTHLSSDRGSASALLTWEMMLYFKKEGYETYDWGGVVLDSTDPRYSITQFKLSFGGTSQRLFDYSCRFPRSRSRRLWLRLLRGLRKTHQRLL